jgi:hypothetical protein
MPSSVRVAIALWTLAVASAVAGVVTENTSARLSLALYALAVALGVVVGVTLLALAARRGIARRVPQTVPDPSPLRRLDYLPSVTSAAPRLRWQGDRYWAIGRRGDAAPRADDERELRGSAAPRPARSTGAMGAISTTVATAGDIPGRPPEAFVPRF